ncbi:hypothetical protein E4U42_007549, partial [Claviceps africana]
QEPQVVGAVAGGPRRRLRGPAAEGPGPADDGAREGRVAQEGVGDGLVDHEGRLLRHGDQGGGGRRPGPDAAVPGGHPGRLRVPVGELPLQHERL